MNESIVRESLELNAFKVSLRVKTFAGNSTKRQKQIKCDAFIGILFCGNSKGSQLNLSEKLFSLTVMSDTRRKNIPRVQMSKMRKAT